MTKDIRPRSEQKIDLKQDSLTINDWLFIIYAIVISVVIFSSASLIIYFVQDYYLMTDAKIKGGILLGLINIGTIFSIFLLGLAKKTPQTKRISIGHNLVAMLLLLVALLMFYLKLSVSFVYLSACGITAGIGYGLFLISTRNYASTVSIQCDRPQLLTAYNNTANSASLISFLIIFILSFLINYIPYDFYSVIFIINIAFVLCSAAFFLLIRKTLL